MPQIPDSNPERGQSLIRSYGCGSCHEIPGIRQADGNVGPPLRHWADRQYIAGTLPNTPENLIHWIRFPQAVEPGTVMPNLNIAEDEAHDMAAYLYTLTNEGQLTDVFSTPRAVLGGLFFNAEDQEHGSVPNTGQQDQAGQQLIQQGEQVFANNCAQCHGQNGEGQVGPALAGNSLVTSQNPAQVIDTVLHGRGQMPAFQGQLSNEQLAGVISYIRNSWGNTASPVNPDQLGGGQSQDQNDGSQPDGQSGDPGGQSGSQQQGEQTSPVNAKQRQVTISLSIQNRAFDNNTLTVPAGAQVTLTLTNLDRMPHNFALYQDSTAKQALFNGQVFSGPERTITMEFTAPAAPGTYYFRCDVHPYMNGALIVE